MILRNLSRDLLSKIKRKWSQNVYFNRETREFSYSPQEQELNEQPYKKKKLSEDDININTKVDCLL